MLNAASRAMDALTGDVAVPDSKMQCHSANLSAAAALSPVQVSSDAWLPPCQ